jgi:uncharacterized protein YnzC (UPF0291/DUF896 family)
MVKDLVSNLREQAKLREEFIDSLYGTMLVLAQENAQLRMQIHSLTIK